MSPRATMIYNAIPIIWLFGGPVVFILVAWALIAHRPEFWQMYVVLAFMAGGAHQSWILPMMAYSYFTE